MPSRPQILFPLFGQLTQFSGIGPKIALNLSKLDINSPRDLLFNLPYSLLTRNKVDTVFVMSTAKHGVFVSKIDNQVFEQSPLLVTIQDLFAKEVLKEKQES